jgi:quercetin dioxygenase-like cupin family protein
MQLVTQTVERAAAGGTSAPRSGGEQAVRPRAAVRDAGTAFTFLGTPTWLRADAAQTGGAFGLIEEVLPAGFESPYHVHRGEDESFYVLEGEMTFVHGAPGEEELLRAGPGTFVFLPRGISHGFRAEGPSAARVLLLVTPGGFERFVAKLSLPAGAPPPGGPPDPGPLAALAAKYHVEILGPLPR